MGQMRLYIQGKFYLTLLKSFLIGALFALRRFDLWLVWTILTFVLGFMPMGSVISTIAAIPFVIFDPNKSFIDIAICVFWPLIVHNIVGNVLEPRVFANSLSLHPVTVLFSLTFWTALWGIVGALVCVPLTAM